MHTFTSNYGLGHAVLIDGCSGVRGVIIAVAHTSHGIKYEVSWVANAALGGGWIDEFRLSPAPAAR